MSRTVVVFREAAVAKAKSDAEQDQVVARIGDALGKLAHSDLTVKLTGFPPSYGAIERDFNTAAFQANAQYQLGNLGRNTMRTRPDFNWDFFFMPISFN